MALRRFVGVAVALGLLGVPRSVVAEEQKAEVAAGATIAVGPADKPQIAGEETPWMLFAAGVAGGIAIVPGKAVGGYGRFIAEGMLVRDPARSGVVWGFWHALEGWGASEAGGFAMPVVFYVGYRPRPFVATLGGGFNLFSIDNLDHDGGFGIFSPRGEARIGISVGGLLLLLTSDIQRRWLWGRDDITLFQAGLSLGWETFTQSRQ